MESPEQDLSIPTETGLLEALETALPAISAAALEEACRNARIDGFRRSTITLELYQSAVATIGYLRRSEGAMQDA